MPGQEFIGVTDSSRLNQTITDDPRLNRDRDHKTKKDSQKQADGATNGSIAKSPIYRQHIIANTPYSSPKHNIHQLLSDI